MSTLSCPCGASIEADISQPSQETVCPECGQVLEIVVSVDKRTQRKQIGILVKPGALSPKKKVKAGTKTEEVHVFKCTCGAQISIVPRGADTIYTCKACQAEFTATLRQGKTGAVSALVLRPVLAMPVAERPAAPPPPAGRSAPAGKPAPSAAGARPDPAKAAAPPAKLAAKAAPPAAGARAAPAKAVAPPPAAKPPSSAPVGSAPLASAPVNLAARENLLMMAKGTLGAQEVLMNEDVLTVACFCGKDLQLPKMDFHREIIKCASCRLSFRVFAAQNPKNQATMAIMIPQKSG